MESTKIAVLSKAANTLYTSHPIGEAPEGNGYGVKRHFFQNLQLVPFVLQDNP